MMLMEMQLYNLTPFFTGNRSLKLVLYIEEVFHPLSRDIHAVLKRHRND